MERKKRRVERERRRWVSEKEMGEREGVAAHVDSKHCLRK